MKIVAFHSEQILEYVFYMITIVDVVFNNISNHWQSMEKYYHYITEHISHTNLNVIFEKSER